MAKLFTTDNTQLQTKISFPVVVSYVCLVLGVVSIIPFFGFFLWLPSLLLSLVCYIIFKRSGKQKESKIAFIGLLLSLASLIILLIIISKGF